MLKLIGIGATASKESGSADASTTVGRKKLGVGFAYITWSDNTASWQLLRPGYYGHHRAAGWRLTRARSSLIMIHPGIEPGERGPPRQVTVACPAPQKQAQKELVARRLPTNLPVVTSTDITGYNSLPPNIK